MHSLISLKLLRGNHMFMSTRWQFSKIAPSIFVMARNSKSII